MKVQVEENLFIESDDRNFIVRRYFNTEKQSGKKQAENLAYFPSLQGCLKFIVKMKVKESTAATLSELALDLKRIEEYIHSQIPG